MHFLGLRMAKLQNWRLSVMSPDNWIRKPFDDDFMNETERMNGTLTKYYTEMNQYLLWLHDRSLLPLDGSGNRH